MPVGIGFLALFQHQRVFKSEEQTPHGRLTRKTCGLIWRLRINLARDAKQVVEAERLFAICCLSPSIKLSHKPRAASTVSVRCGLPLAIGDCLPLLSATGSQPNKSWYSSAP